MPKAKLWEESLHVDDRGNILWYKNGKVWCNIKSFNELKLLEERNALTSNKFISKIYSVWFWMSNFIGIPVVKSIHSCTCNYGIQYSFSMIGGGNWAHENFYLGRTSFLGLQFGFPSWALCYCLKWKMTYTLRTCCVKYCCTNEESLDPCMLGLCVLNEWSRGCLEPALKLTMLFQLRLGDSYQQDGGNIDECLTNTE